MARGKIVLIAVAVVGTLATGVLAFSQDGDFRRDVMRALFGLSGGNTAGGQ